jgi:pullulanase/glycogen debranching enzyme
MDYPAAVERLVVMDGLPVIEHLERLNEAFVHTWWHWWFLGQTDKHAEAFISADPGRRRPLASINFITAHDGFTLRDLVSYNGKHNDANGEDGNDGSDDNQSWNCGAEGETQDPAILKLRARQQRNLLTTLLLSQGVPMIAHGDELGRTQQGNNNVYCQDNELSWVDWHLDQPLQDLLDFTRQLVQLRRDHPVLRRRRFFRGDAPDGSLATWPGSCQTETGCRTATGTGTRPARSACCSTARPSPNQTRKATRLPTTPS